MLPSDSYTSTGGEVAQCADAGMEDVGAADRQIAVATGYSHVLFDILLLLLVLMFVNRRIESGWKLCGG